MADSPGKRPILLTSSDAPSEPSRRYQHYGRRKGPKLSAYQAGLFENLLPQIALTPQSGVDPKLYFTLGAVRDVWLEIGFGAGEHIAAQAESNPEIGLIGAEPYIAGAAKLLAKIAARSISNVRIYPSDAGDILDALPDLSVGRIFVLFPDPWPKARHHKRRLITMETLDRLARAMRHGAELRFATDDRGYLVWALERFCAHPEFRWTADSPEDWRCRSADWPETRYESKAKLMGRDCTFLRLIRI